MLSPIWLDERCTASPSERRRLPISRRSRTDGRAGEAFLKRRRLQHAAIGRTSSVLPGRFLSFAPLCRPLHTWSVDWLAAIHVRPDPRSRVVRAASPPSPRIIRRSACSEICSAESDDRVVRTAPDGRWHRYATIPIQLILARESRALQPFNMYASIHLHSASIS